MYLYLKVDDVCLITEEKVLRPSSPLGRIVEASVGKDGLVGSYKLRTKSGVVTRPVQRLHFWLPVVNRPKRFEVRCVNAAL